MTRKTALELIRRMDINREIARAGRPLTAVDLIATEEILAQARREERATAP